jgi:hypothetical protein
MPVGREHDQQRREAEPGDAQVVLGVAGDAVRGIEHPNDHVGAEHSEDRGGHSDADGEPDAVDTLAQRPSQVPGAEPAGDCGGRAVREEDAQADTGLHDRGGDAEPG